MFLEVQQCSCSPRLKLFLPKIGVQFAPRSDTILLDFDGQRVFQMAFGLWPGISVKSGKEVKKAGFGKEISSGLFLKND